ncbi:MAG: MFS transporter [Acidimicrobiia bacterium]
MSVEDLQIGWRGRHVADSTVMGRRFTILWIGQMVSQLGDRMAYISIPLFIASLQGSSLQLGIAYALENAPVLIIGLVGGVFIDRLRVRWLMIAADVIRALLFLALAVVAGGDVIGERTGQVLVVFAVAFMVGGLTNLFETALLTIIPDVVEGRFLARANGRIAATINLGNIAGPALAGLLVAATSSFTLVFVIDALTFVVSAVSLLMIGRIDTERLAATNTFRSDLLTGLRYVWNEVRLRVTTIAVAIANLVVGFIEATFVLIAAREELVGATEDWQLGVLYSTFGLGAIVGSVVAPRVAHFIGLGKTTVVGMIGFPIGFILFVDTPFSLLGLIYLFIAFLMLMLINVPIATIRQAYTPAILRGRVIAAARAIGWTTLPLGALLGTVVAEATGQFVTMARWCAVVILIAGLALLPTKVWRDTFGAGRGRRVQPSTGRKVLEI